MAFAFAAKDPFMLTLAEHEDPEIRALVEARLAVKSTLKETRAGRFVDMAQRVASRFPAVKDMVKTRTRYFDDMLLRSDRRPVGIGH